MVVVIVNQNCVFPFEREGKSPVTAHRHRPVTFQISLQRMESPSGSAHIFRGSSIVQSEKLLPQALAVAGLDFRLRASSEEQFDSLVTEAFDHPYSV